MKKYFLLCSFLLLLNIRTYAWIFPEHRDITFIAIQKLSPVYRAILDSLWTEARAGYESRLSEAVIDATQSLKPTHLDYATSPAIAGHVA